VRLRPERFRECARLLGWSMQEIASRLGMNERQVRRWASGQYPVPDKVADWLERVVTAVAGVPPPPPPRG